MKYGGTSKKTPHWYLAVDSPLVSGNIIVFSFQVIGERTDLCLLSQVSFIMNNSILDIKLQAALNEIVEAAQHPLYKEVIETWLSDYKELSKEMLTEARGQVTVENIHGRAMCEFERVYMHLDMLMDYYRLETLSETAMLEYHSILLANSKAHDNLRLQQWVRKYEKLGVEELLEPPIEGDSSNNVRTIYDIPYVVTGSEFKKSMEFYQVFSHLFWDEQILPDRLAEFRKG